jgi:hypothetical protein
MSSETQTLTTVTTTSTHSVTLTATVYTAISTTTTVCNSFTNQLNYSTSDIVMTTTLPNPASPGQFTER